MAGLERLAGLRGQERQEENREAPEGPTGATGLDGEPNFQGERCRGAPPDALREIYGAGLCVFALAENLGSQFR